ncbi:MAG: ester cyclase [Bacteroidota bacterium]
MKSLLFSCLVAASLLMTACSGNQEVIQQEYQRELTKMEQQRKDALKAVVQNFYAALSTTPNDQTAAQTTEWMASNWQSIPTPNGGPNLDGFVKTLFMFHGMIPDLKWEVQEMLVDDNRVIVRSRATGTPNSPEGYFFGVPTDGSKSFDVQTIDIHTVENGKMVSAFHTEDWARAIQQVSASN